MTLRIGAIVTVLTLISTLVVSAPGLIGFAACADPAWTTFTSKAGGFSVTMPGSPVQKETQQSSFVGTVTNHIFTAASGSDQFTVDYSDIPRFALDFAGADTIYDHAKGALLQRTYGKEISYGDTTVSGAAGKSLVYDTPRVQGQPAMRGDAILVLVGARLYVIDGVVPAAEADAKSEKFLSSVTISR
jgi:hypothetical protein